MWVEYEIHLIIVTLGGLLSDDKRNVQRSQLERNYYGNRLN